MSERTERKSPRPLEGRVIREAEWACGLPWRKQRISKVPCGA